MHHAKAHHTPRQSSSSSPSDETRLLIKASLAALAIAILGVIGWYVFIVPNTKTIHSSPPTDFSSLVLPTMTTHPVVMRKSEDSESKKDSDGDSAIPMPDAEELLERRTDAFAKEYVLDAEWQHYSRQFRGCISLRFTKGMDLTYADALATCTTLLPTTDAPN